MNLNDIVLQIIRMRGLMLETSRTVIAERFRNLFTNTFKVMYGDDDDRTLKWVREDAAKFMQACQLTAPRAPINPNVTATETDLAKLIDKWETVNHWRVNTDAEWKPMSEETVNVKATLLHELREISSVRPE